MNQPADPHDAFFKEVFSGVAVAHNFVAHYLPSEVVACLDLTTYASAAAGAKTDQTLRQIVPEHFHKAVK